MRIFKSYYSRVTVRETDTDIQFFVSLRGQYNTVGNRSLTYVDTNIDHGNIIIRKFIVNEIRFYTSDDKFKKHIIQYGYFIFRVGDIDTMICPIHMMSNHMTYFKRVCSMPIDIREREYFSIQLRLDEVFGKECKVTCELVGMMEY